MQEKIYSVEAWNNASTYEQLVVAFARKYPTANITETFGDAEVRFPNDNRVYTLKFWWAEPTSEYDESSYTGLCGLHAIAYAVEL
jgi:hypothetical protein